MKSPKAEKLVKEKFVYRITILLLAIWIILLYQKNNTFKGNIENDQPPPKKDVVLEDETKVPPKPLVQDVINEDSESEDKEKALIAEILTNSFKESKKLNTTKPKEPAPDNQITNSVQNENVTELEELIQICRSLREEGKTLQSLKKLREAKLSYPDASKLLWELHLTYEVMSLHQKSEDELKKIISLGKEVAKDHWEIAKLKLTEQPVVSNSKKEQNFVFGTILESAPDIQSTGETVLVDIEIKSQLKTKPDAKDITLIIDFYDLVDDSKIQTTLSDQPEATWKTAPIDWSPGNSEIVQWKYRLPIFPTNEEETTNSRHYYGFIARLYYKDIVQDIYASPRTLLEPKQSLNRSFIDNSLFPPLNN